MIATIGYQGTTVATLVRRLADASINHVIDVRAVPLSRKPGFSKRQLAAELLEVGVRYTSLRGLGTPPAGRVAARRHDTRTMRAIFAEQLDTEAGRRDLALACEIAGDSRACLICFERCPADCHRAAVAEAMGGSVQHLFCDPPVSAPELPL